LKKYKTSKHHSGGNPAGALLRLILLAFIGIFVGFVVWGFHSSKVSRFDRFNVVVSASNTFVISLNPKSSTANLVRLPDDLYVPSVAHGYGQYTIAKVFEVGQLDRRGGEVLSDTVSDFLGIPIDGYVRLPKNASGEIHNIFSAIMFALQARQTDLSLFDRIMFAWSLARMRYDKMDVVDLGKSSSPLLLADGSAGQSIEKDLVDNLLQDEFSEDKIRAEDLRIQVVNSTQYAGLGSRGARILNNSGMKVVSVDTTDLPVDKCQLRMDPKLKNSITIQRIESVFVCEVGSPIDGAKGDIVVVLGTNYLNKLTK
jgi:hypothetical protein